MNRNFRARFVPAGILSRRDLAPGAKLALGLIAECADELGQTSFTLDKLSGTLGITPRQASKYLFQLQRLGLLVKQRNGRCDGVLIRLTLPAKS